MMADIVDRNERQKLTRRVIRSRKHTSEEKSKQQLPRANISRQAMPKNPVLQCRKGNESLFRRCYDGSDGECCRRNFKA